MAKPVTMATPPLVIFAMLPAAPKPLCAVMGIRAPPKFAMTATLPMEINATPIAPPSLPCAAMGKWDPASFVMTATPPMEMVALPPVCLRI